MRLSIYILAAGLSASALAAPGTRRRQCKESKPAVSMPSSAPHYKPSSVATVPKPKPSSGATVPKPKPSSGATAPGGSTSSGLKFIGVSEAGAEFGNNMPGVPGVDYTFPDISAIQTLMDDGMNMFRIPFRMERIAKGKMTADLDPEYLANLTAVVTHITAAGKYAAVDAHNYGRYDGQIISSTDDFKTFWANIATHFADNAYVAFGCNNEPHDMNSDTQTAELMQACVDGVRGAGATKQYIFVAGTSWTGAWTWTQSGNSEHMRTITDSAGVAPGLLVYEMHQYLDSDGSGTSPDCVSATIGAERVADATKWLRQNAKLGIIGEFSAGNNTVCQSAIQGMLEALAQNSDLWIGALWWAAGPWWANNIYSLEPHSGPAYLSYKDTLLAKKATT